MVFELLWDSPGLGSKGGSFMRLFNLFATRLALGG